MKWASLPSAYRNCILRASVRTGRNFSPARNVRSITAPSDARRSLVRTKAPPLPGLTCWNSRILKTVPSTSMWLPFLNWFVEIMSADQCRSAPACAELRHATGRPASRLVDRIGPVDEAAGIEELTPPERPALLAGELGAVADVVPGLGDGGDLMVDDL